MRFTKNIHYTCRYVLPDCLLHGRSGIVSIWGRVCGLAAAAKFDVTFGWLDGLAISVQWP